MRTKLLAIAAFTLCAVGLQAQCINGVLSYPIYKTGAQLVKDYDEAGKEIVRIEYDLVFTSKETFRDLYDSWEYTIIGFADDGVKDLDLKVSEYDDLLEEWVLVAEDASEGSVAEITVTPEVTATYMVEVIVYAFHEEYSAARYGLMFVHD